MSEGNRRVVAFLIQLRLDHGFSIKELSQLTHLSVYILKKTEECKRLIKNNEVRRLSKVYKIRGHALNILLMDLEDDPINEEELERKKVNLFKC